ncbi:DUF3291 domain-containing protein [Shewanella eurypsychrophilus]|uniref:DUF3291 domain-containing protein n=1 Tax=Shewanella eurypsychrophilus TaxID=2593656 RepID=A0ABX6VCY4_9GAMM|nr:MULTISPECIES: DUF3291 domain-containing protein [Shewanella]QFU25372.1 DUF3291 domain-containing protein [Shewanella sp. YLB-09]QPG60515.1 DUF3291 domain-containing protein [Shewanella eurypsychrophilus]
MQLAQLNIARTKAAMDEPLMKEFVDNLEPINAIAESSQGFVWRLQDESGDATSIQAFEDPSLIVNISVWESVESLKAFIFKTHHIDFLKRKSEWFDKLDDANYVLWWVPEGHQPSVEEAKERLMHLRDQGESAYAFSFKPSRE